MTIKEQKINLFKNLALTLHEKSVWFFQHAFHLKPKRISKSYLKSFLSSKKVDLTKVLLADENYHYVSIAEMKDIILHDWVDRKKYEKDIFDCDDFADIFKAHMEERYKINSVGVARSIELLDPKTRKHLNWHRANVFIADEDNVMKLWFLEPQTDRVVEVSDYNELIKLTGWLNRLNIFDF